jgi:hypothetical protein
MTARQQASVIASVLWHLERSESGESDPKFQDCYRLAWITTLYCSRGYSQPYIAAHYTVFGCHPAELTRRLDHARRVHLGKYYDDFYPQNKKAAQSEVSPPKARSAAAGK